MYCPNCGSQNPEGTKFCRTCGANLELIPQALTGHLPEDRHTRRRRRRGEDRPPNLGHGITTGFTGIGFVLVALSILLFFPGGRIWWFWMLIPAFSLLGRGVAEIVSARAALAQMQNNQSPAAAIPQRRQTGELPPEPPSYTLPPPSVTEGTTRHLDPEKDRYPRSR